MALAGYSLPDPIASTGSTLVQAAVVAAALSTILGFYVLVRNNWPRAGKVLALPFRALWWVLAHLAVLPRALWRQLWRDVHGVSRGPVKRMTDKVAHWLRWVIHETTAPEFEASRKASLEQHEEQNTRLDMFDGRLEIIEAKLPGPRPTSSRSRAEDEPCIACQQIHAEGEHTT